MKAIEKNVIRSSTQVYIANVKQRNICTAKKREERAGKDEAKKDKYIGNNQK